jgi:hypothetical protein
VIPIEDVKKGQCECRKKKKITYKFRANLLFSRSGCKKGKKLHLLPSFWM